MTEKKKSPGRVRAIIIGLIRGILALAFFSGLYTNRPLVLIVALLALFLTFLPKLITIVYRTDVPAEFELILLLFIYGILFLGEVRGLFAAFWWWDILLNLIAAIALGLVGLAVMYALYKDNKIRASPLVVVIFSFCFAVAIGTVWELFEFALDQLIGSNLQKSGLFDTMSDLLVNTIGALFISLVGYVYIKQGKISMISSFILKFVERNPKLFHRSKTLETSSDEILRLIQKGEHNKLEFKSTIRTNLHTQKIDKRMEHALLKTIVAYLNSEGGTLLVGVSDNGEVRGLETDNFANNDKLRLYITNLIKHHIGQEYIPFISYELFPVNDRHVLKIECLPSDTQVFLKIDKTEEFYVRNGPSSARLEGSALIDYIRHRFPKH